MVAGSEGPPAPTQHKRLLIPPASLNQQISGLQTLTRQQQGKNEEGEHRKNVVFLLQDRLTGVSVNFKEVLEVRTKNLQSTRARTDNFISQVSQNVQPLAAAAALHQQSASPLYTSAASASGSATATGGRNTPTFRAAASSSAPPGLLGDGSSANAGGGGALLSLNPVVSDQQLMLMEEAQPANAYIQQRGEAIEAIESTIAELGSIFGQLASMVSEQSEMIERIDANVGSSLPFVPWRQCFLRHADTNTRRPRPSSRTCRAHKKSCSSTGAACPETGGLLPVRASPLQTLCPSSWRFC